MGCLCDCVQPQTSVFGSNVPFYCCQWRSAGARGQTWGCRSLRRRRSWMWLWGLKSLSRPQHCTTSSPLQPASAYISLLSYLFSSCWLSIFRQLPIIAASFRQKRLGSCLRKRIAAIRRGKNSSYHRVIVLQNKLIPCDINFNVSTQQFFTFQRDSFTFMS